MPNQNAPNSGKVYLVGAGPGDPALITLRGIECLQHADVVLYDYLVNPHLLRHIQPACQQICLGRHGHTRIWSQEEINQQLIILAKEGKTVVRLKSGDPAIFARGAEEAELLANNAIPFEIVPGITTALAASSYAGVPITHRDFASAVAMVTAHESPDKPESRLDYEALARFPGTLVFYMGVTTAEKWTAKLIASGKPADTPVAIVRRCSFPDQQTILCTLGEVAARFKSPTKIRPPAIVIVGQVTKLAEKLSWFEQRPLSGVNVMVCRPKEQAGSLCQALQRQGAQVLLQPAIEISPPDDWSPVDAVLSRLDEFDWIVFSSANGVRQLLDRLLATNRDVRALGNVKLATIGPGTTEALADYRLKTDLQPGDEYRAETLAAALAGEANGKRFLLARASRGRELLLKQLESAGGIVEQVVVYRSTDIAEPDPEIATQLDAGQIDYISVTSSAMARSLVALFGEQLNKTRLASISPITSETLRELGFEPALEAEAYTMPGLVQAIITHQGSLSS